MREIQGRDTLRVLQQISELMDWGASGLAIASNNTPDLVQRINEISNQGVPVVTFNTDAPDSRRLCFVGMDNYRAGQTAAGLIRQMLPSGGILSTTARISAASGAFWTLWRIQGIFSFFPSSPASTGTITPMKSPSTPFRKLPLWPASISPPTDRGASAKPFSY